jgi:peptidoglycan/LPS O-acetylase OafA/YrhL
MLIRAPQKGIYIPSLDGLRALAFFLVFFSHSGFGKIIPGGFGVTVFFFISGFLITSLLRHEFAVCGLISLKKFYMRRVLRIWPAFYLVLFVGAALTQLHVLRGEILWPGFLSQCMHVANYYSIYFGDGITMGSVVYWSLAVEEHFYLIFPLLYMALLRMDLCAKNQMRVLIALCLAVLAWRCLLVFFLDAASQRTNFASDTRFDSLLFGCALAVYRNPALDPTTLSDRAIKYFLLPAGIILLVTSFLVRNAEFRETLRYTLQGVGLAPIFIAAIRFPGWGPFRILNWKWVRFIGTLSYSLYLVHYTVIQGINLYWPNMNSLRLSAVSLFVAFILSYAI